MIINGKSTLLFGPERISNFSMVVQDRVHRNRMTIEQKIERLDFIIERAIAQRQYAVNEIAKLMKEEDI